MRGRQFKDRGITASSPVEYDGLSSKALSIMKRLYPLFLILLMAVPVWSQNARLNLQGSVLDAYLKNGVKDCHVTLMRTDSTVVDCESKVYEVGNDASRFTTIYDFFIPCQPGAYLIRVSREGYEEGWAKVTVPEGCKEKRIIVPTIHIRKLPAGRQLGEAVVTATRVKVKMRGDTLVYDATAFNMPEGSMLHHLIEQLPGASMNENGEIFINGRKINELTLNTRKLFGGNKAVLLENLPYFTVKELKVFERHSLQAVMARDLNAKKEYVMDINLKAEYALGGIANADMAGGTHDRYLAKFFGFLLTRTMAVGGFANLNNVNDESNGASGMWMYNTQRVWGDKNHPSTRKKTGVSLDYQSVKKEFSYPAVQSWASLTFDRDDHTNESSTYNEFFLPAGTTYSRMNQNMRARFADLTLREHFVYMPLRFQCEGSFYYQEKRTHQSSTLSQWGWDGETTRQLTGGMGTEKDYGLGYGRITFYPPWLGNLGIYFNELSAYHWVREGFSRQQSTGAQSAADYRHEYQDAATTRYTYDPTISYKLPTGKWLGTALKVRYKNTRKKSTDNLFVLSNLEGWGLEDSVKLDLIPSSKEMLWRAYDPVNSTFSDYRTQEGEFSLTLNLIQRKKQPFGVTLELPLNLYNERLAYRRDALDTLATRGMLAFNPSLRLRYKNLSLGMSFRTSSPGLMGMMPYRDARNPLNIVAGNPSLRNNRQFRAYAEWRRTVKEKTAVRRNTRVSSDFTCFMRSVAQGMTYNPQTTAYTYRPENVSGNWVWNSSCQLSFALGGGQLWWLDNEVRAGVWHSVDLVSVEGANEAQLNRVETVKPGETLKIRYTGKSTKATLLGEVDWRRSWGYRPSQEGLSTFDFRYGLTAQHTIEAWNTTLNVDAFMYSRRGYSSGVMNRDECIVNAGVSQPLFHGRLILKLEGRDILNQQSATSYEVNAQGRTESWHRILPSYVMLHAVYHFNRKPKQ